MIYSSRLVYTSIRKRFLTFDYIIRCWGANSFGQLGDGTVQVRLTPTFVVGDSKRMWKSVSCGRTHTCGLTVTGRAFCWGSNRLGELGDGSNANNFVKEGTPKMVEIAEEFRSITAGDAISCAWTSSGVAFCWGDNSYGQLGIGPIGAKYKNSLMPKTVEAQWNWTEISCASTHCCGQDVDGRAYCWGYGGNLALGDGSTTGLKFEPTVVAGVWCQSGNSWTWIVVPATFLALLCFISFFKKVRTTNTRAHMMALVSSASAAVAEWGTFRTR